MPPAHPPVPGAPASNGRDPGLEKPFETADLVIHQQQAQIEDLKRERAWLEQERERLDDLLTKAEINEEGLTKRLGELQEVIMGRQPAPPPDRSWRTRIKWALSILFATDSTPGYDIW